MIWPISLHMYDSVWVRSNINIPFDWDELMNKHNIGGFGNHPEEFKLYLTWRNVDTISDHLKVGTKTKKILFIILGP